jgi:hypothetical protein
MIPLHLTQSSMLSLYITSLSAKFITIPYVLGRIIMQGIKAFHIVI